LSRAQVRADPHCLAGEQLPAIDELRRRQRERFGLLDPSNAPAAGWSTRTLASPFRADAHS
jgi:hypothetical protein